jgi:uncharacterized protein
MKETYVIVLHRSGWVRETRIPIRSNSFERALAEASISQYNDINYIEIYTLPRIEVEMTRIDVETTWIQTFLNVKFFPLNPDPADVEIEDIIHALSMKCRFGGHCRNFYSVAQHSVLVAEHVPEEHRLVALLHDATEAYLPDVCRPIKGSLVGFEEIERRLYLAIAERFGLPNEIPLCVKNSDNRALVTEARDVMGPPPDRWSVSVEPFSNKIVCMDPKEVEVLYRTELYCEISKRNL